jgi:hypothetical protein
VIRLGNTSRPESGGRAASPSGSVVYLLASFWRFSRAWGESMLLPKRQPKYSSSRAVILPGTLPARDQPSRMSMQCPHATVNRSAQIPRVCREPPKSRGHASKEGRRVTASHEAGHALHEGDDDGHDQPRQGDDRSSIPLVLNNRFRVDTHLCVRALRTGEDGDHERNPVLHCQGPGETMSRHPMFNKGEFSACAELRKQYIFPNHQVINTLRCPLRPVPGRVP